MTGVDRQGRSGPELGEEAPEGRVENGGTDRVGLQNDPYAVWRDRANR